MNNRKNIVIICRSLREAHLLNYIKRDHEKYIVAADDIPAYIVASDDVRVHHEVARLPWVAEACWIEKLESFYKVALDVIKILGVINQWLESLGDNRKGIPGELLFWIQHCEGGMTTQRIQDLLLLIRSYHYLIDKYNIERIVIFSHPYSRWEDDILVATARAKGIDCEIIGLSTSMVLKTRLVSFCKSVLKEPYCVCNLLYSKFRNYIKFGKLEVSEKEVILQLCSSQYKHLAHTVPLMKSLKSKGVTPVALCWEASRGADLVRKEDLRADELERWVPLWSIWSVFIRTLKTWKKAIAKRQEFTSLANLEYESVPLGDLLWPSVNYFLLNETPKRYRLKIASERYFKQHSPLFIRFWTSIFYEAVIPYRVLTKMKKPVIFSNWGFHDLLDSPYENHNNKVPMDLAFALGPSHRQKLLHRGFSPENIHIVGQVAWEHFTDFKSHYTSDDSRLFLKIPLDFNTYIFFDPGLILRGYDSVQEHIEKTNFLLNFASQQPSIAIIIKPPPGHKSGMLESLVNSYSLKNVFSIDKNIYPHHCINGADLIITKYSTLGIEAMFFEKPVVSVILDKEDNFKIYGDAAEYVTSIKGLNELLTELINDLDYRQRWAKNINNRIKLFLKDNFYQASHSPSEMIANTINCYLHSLDIDEPHL